jgi:hypothetical protein
LVIVARKKVRKTKRKARKKSVKIEYDEPNWKKMCTSCDTSKKWDGVGFGLFLLAIAALFYYNMFQWELVLGAFAILIIISSLLKK